jgi:hypothetical protein
MVGVITLWPFYPDRFLIALAPLGAVCMVVGLLHVSTVRLTVLPGPWPGRVALGVATAIFLLPAVKHTWRGSRDGSLTQAIHGQYGDALPAVAWTATAPDSLAPFFAQTDYLIRWYAHKAATPLRPFRGTWYLRVPDRAELADAVAATLCLHRRGTIVYTPSDSLTQQAVDALRRRSRGRIQLDSLRPVAPGVTVQRVACGVAPSPETLLRRAAPVSAAPSRGR